MTAFRTLAIPAVILLSGTAATARSPVAQQQQDLFNKGFSACLESKGYTIK